jgi:hypothetical protein
MTIQRQSICLQNVNRSVEKWCETYAGGEEDKVTQKIFQDIFAVSTQTIMQGL